MMIEYESCHRETVLRLLSHLPSARKGVPVQQILNTYEGLAERRLYVWKESDKVVGVIGIHLQQQTFAVHHIAIHPSFRNRGIGNSLLQSVQEEHISQAMCSTHETKDFLDRCWQKQSQFS
ncbi:GNAT family N-acetyltransferase [Planococcus sp. CP5-4]|uniref:GNAT family N-acetyltransferase n=1 Tax=unclassified Planococcus (in: firmicutes) TaxID=2662419 RepID=UPI001C22C205|nr:MULTISPECIES: GNAT family N-acetyltransferase [unclassified Planococcus (in: firmicutes)]MBU9673309.1 GNAT family N-acetyltransferase [Planococcus sp. CP5-4_YE]MBU9675123.1 GNAT family N-acetyltransferase [Planococcus sp. CP5-4_YE]MBV0908082.1 GNAT family N-acetyltransferase [Planococcus sp. CP5-4_UN]MBW6062143.1 GNAT family N-acetyltransferase [Planococcus sp. CP5-4]